MRRFVPVVLAAVVLAFSVSAGFAYTKPITWDKDHGQIVFQDQWHFSPHGWIIGKALVLLSQSDRPQEGAFAARYLLPMLEGVTFNDVWGDADLAGASMLDYYIPQYDEDDHHGFGSALFAYKNDTESFKAHAFYGFEDAAEEAQFRYDYAVRIFLGGWGSDPRDLMAGWVVDTAGGQDDPQNGRYASGLDQINAGGFSYDGLITIRPTPFGDGGATGHRTPLEALAPLFDLHSTSRVVVDTGSSDPALTTLTLPEGDVFSDANQGGSEWFNNQYGHADDVEVYSGWDAGGQAIYASWTLDAGGVGHGCSGCMLAASSDGDNCDGAAPMLARFPVGSRAHAFFQLGWAIHLLEDVTTPVHTIRSSITTFYVHNDVEKAADGVVGPSPTVYNNAVVADNLPAKSASDLAGLFPFPPQPITVQVDDLSVQVPCWNSQIDPIVDDPVYFKPDWYLQTPTHADEEGLAHRYVRESAELTNTFMPYIECLDHDNGHGQWNWDRMGFFTTYGLDLAIKSTAGLIRSYVELTDVQAPAVTISAPTAGAQLPHNAILTLSYGATDDQTGVASIAGTIDGLTTVGAQPVDNGVAINLLSAFPTPGTHTLSVRAEDYNHNVSHPSVTFTIIVTPESLLGDVTTFVGSGAITQNEGTSLAKKIQAAAAYRAAGDCAAAAEVLQSFISEVKSLTGKKINAAAATTLVADARYLITHCP
jgi:hypothetical protein